MREMVIGNFVSSNQKEYQQRKCRDLKTHGLGHELLSFNNETPKFKDKFHSKSKSVLNLLFQNLCMLFLSIQKEAGEGNCTPLQYSCLENPMDGGAWRAAVHGVAEGRTRLSDFTFTFYFHALEKEMATHSSVLAWRIPGTGEPVGLPSMGLHRVGHD